MSRLKYLLSQSDIFSHFGTVKADTTGTSSSAPPAAGKGGLSKGASSGNLSKSGSQSNFNSKSGRRNRAASEELDEDEKAMAREEDEDAEEDAGPGMKGSVLRQQPSCISGGKMR